MLRFLHEQHMNDEQHPECDMDQTVTDRIEERLKSAFPAGAIERVQVLEYGDDPKVEPERPPSGPLSPGQADRRARRPTRRP